MYKLLDQKLNLLQCYIIFILIKGNILKLEIKDKQKIFFQNSTSSIEIHPLWLRERINTDELVDKNNQQRLYDNTNLALDIVIKNAKIDNTLLDIKFSDGISFKFNIDNLLYELNEDLCKMGPVNKPVLWKSNSQYDPYFNYSENFHEKEEMYNLLKNFYKYGFVIVRKVPTEDSFIVKFANSIGTVRPTNFGNHFNVLSVPKPNDLAYTSLALSPHTDNPYRKPVPCIQLLHCLENEVSGGLSTLVDGFAVASDLRKNNKKYFDILSQVKVRFRFDDKDVILENWGELIELNEKKNVKQVRYSSRLDYVPALEKEKLNLFFEARKLLSKLYNSNNFEIKFKLMPGDLMIMDNHRLLHGRTRYDSSEGKRHLQGCYIDYDSSEGKLRHLQRKFKKDY